MSKKINFRTLCPFLTITNNSQNEKQVYLSHLPTGKTTGKAGAKAIVCNLLLPIIQTSMHFKLRGIRSSEIAKHCNFSVVLGRYQCMRIMAKPIKETPVLTGKDAALFIQNMNEGDVNRVSPKERARIRENFAKLKSIAKF